MPHIELEGDYLDPPRILAVMLFPTDEKRRRAYYTIKVAQMLLEDKNRQDWLQVHAAFVEDLLDAPSHSEMRTHVAESTKKGTVAGDFIANIFAMTQFPQQCKEPSVRKALVIARSFARQTKFGDGTSLPKSATAIRRYFDEFQSVAHLWAAFRLHQSFPIRDHRELLASPGAVRDFLGMAGLIQDFGCAFVPKRARPIVPLLDPTTIWRVPDSARRLVPPLKAPPSYAMAVLAKYKATKGKR